ncbi:hypothetical protein OMW55_11230 [Sphingomonas sp. BN140010]|uniref:Argininosuccinate lyase n=1 Tax=Sphingomonas arvum TaxID=2992113 RepID=A0ABT3JHA6_9SPHN|nr:hypothetical protein [Sphingomonas sp. BN140010]MCW3798376.1 hypothetical protein [Sphingomonas sp. BN140010]
MRTTLLLTLTLLSACGRNERPPAPTAEESRRLDQAEAELNALGNEEGPLPEDSGPSSSSE